MNHIIRPIPTGQASIASPNRSCPMSFLSMPEPENTGWAELTTRRTGAGRVALALYYAA